MRILSIAFMAVILAATALAATIERTETPPRRSPPPPAQDWLRGGAEPEAVFGPHRFTVPRRTLAESDTPPPVRPRTALRERID